MAIKYAQRKKEEKMIRSFKDKTKAKGEKGRMARWQLNMRRGKKKKK